MILWTQTRIAVTPTTGDESSCVEGLNGCAVRGAKTQVHPGRGLGSLFRSDRELYTQGARHRAVIRASLLKVHGADEAERAQYCIIEMAAAFQIGHTKGNVVEHLRVRSLSRKLHLAQVRLSRNGPSSLAA